MIFRGYIDESYDNSQKLFALSCLISSGKDWMSFERSWKLHITAANKRLKKQGRPPITRYHASDCSGRRNEFQGWTHEERDAFVLGLFGIFQRIPLHAVAFDVDLNALCGIFPEWADDRLKTAYSVLTRFVMLTIGEDFNKIGRENHKVTLFHDRTASDGKYDPTILEAFNFQVTDPNFGAKHYFTTMAPLDWQHCIALQPADLVAFEMFKESQARMDGRNRRKSFDALLDMETFGIHKRTFSRETMLKLRKIVDARNR